MSEEEIKLIGLHFVDTQASPTNQPLDRKKRKGK